MKNLKFMFITVFILLSVLSINLVCMAVDNHQHYAGIPVVMKEPTTTNVGTKITRCAICNKIMKTEVIPTLNKSAKGHIHKASITWSYDKDNHWKACTSNDGTKFYTDSHTAGTPRTTKAATATTTGVRVTSCTVCNAPLKVEVIPATGKTTSATHTHKAGTTWKYDANYHWKECTANDGYKFYKSAHVAGTAKVTKAATATTTGTKQTKCVTCGRIMKTEIIPATGKTTTATHTHKAGTTWKYDANYHWKECTANDGYKFYKNAHVAGTAKVTKAATATTTGTKQTKCVTCGKIMKTEIIPATGKTTAATHSHVAGASVITKQPTTTEVGTRTTYCKVCGIPMKAEIIPATGSTAGNNNTKPSTPQETHTHTASSTWSYDANNHWKACTANDGYKFYTGSHIAGEAVVTKQPTASITGLKETKCAICGKLMRTEIIPATGKTIVPSNTNEQLSVLPWEVENSNLNQLSIMLRNDSESTKANKNLYALNENVTYFIDFKNGGATISTPVKIVLNLQRNFNVIDSGNGTVDAKNRTITWEYTSGMEQGFSGTKKVTIQYTGLSSSTVTGEKVFPLASIIYRGQIKDKSALILYLYKDSSTMSNASHAPFMHGDANSTTFRPDSTITRAEGALVLARVLYGQNAINSTNVSKNFPDLGETYLEAQKAISLATNNGIIIGYTDGTYKPNRTMTRAEFIKIIASHIEKDASNKSIMGLEVKNINSLVKLYNNGYSANGQNHWAIKEVSLMYRLNMTPLSRSESNIRLDDGITRAEVAQLINFYLLRAPSTSTVNTGFSDVPSSHKLAGDIIEATKATHKFRITSAGKEM